MGTKFDAWAHKAKMLGEYEDWEFEFTNRLSVTGGLSSVIMLKGYKGTKERVVLPPVDEIYRLAMTENKYMKELIIPSTVKVIWNSAFMDCHRLEKVEFECDILDLPVRCFSGCIKLESVKLPKNLRSIGSHCFFSCLCLRNIELPESLEIIEDYSFYHSGIQNITIPKNVYYFGYEALVSALRMYSISFETNKIKDLRSEDKGWLLIPKTISVGKIMVNSCNKDLIQSMLLAKQLELVEVI